VTYPALDLQGTAGAPRSAFDTGAIRIDPRRLELYKDWKSRHPGCGPLLCFPGEFHQRAGGLALRKR